MSTFLSTLLGDATGTDPLDQYLSNFGVTPNAPITSPTAVPSSPQIPVAAGPPPMPDQSAPQNQAPTLPAPADIQAPAQPPAAPEQPPVEVVGDAWKPKHTSVLGHIADVLIGAPVFHNQTQKDNLVSAMKGFTDDPLKSIKRVARINPDAAWTMYNTYHDNQIQDKLQQSREDDETLGRVSGLLAVATPQSYSTIKPRLEAYMQARKFDPGIPLPDTYDADAIQGWREGTMKTKDQVSTENIAGYRAQRLKQFQSEIMNTDTYRKARLGQMSQGLAETVRAHQATEGISTEKEQRIANHVPTTTMTKYGPGEISPDKTKMRIAKDGKYYFYLKVGNNWVPNHQEDIPNAVDESQ